MPIVTGEGPAREHGYEIDLLSSLQAQRESVQKLSHNGKALQERGEKTAQGLQEINKVDRVTTGQRELMRILLIVGGFFSRSLHTSHCDEHWPAIRYGDS
jgi:hypothetical protein